MNTWFEAVKRAIHRKNERIRKGVDLKDNPRITGYIEKEDSVEATGHTEKQLKWFNKCFKDDENDISSFDESVRKVYPFINELEKSGFGTLIEHKRGEKNFLLVIRKKK